MGGCHIDWLNALYFFLGALGVGIAIVIVVCIINWFDEGCGVRPRPPVLCIGDTVVDTGKAKASLWGYGAKLFLSQQNRLYVVDYHFSCGYEWERTDYTARWGTEEAAVRWCLTRQLEIPAWLAHATNKVWVE